MKNTCKIRRCDIVGDNMVLMLKTPDNRLTIDSFENCPELIQYFSDWFDNEPVNKEILVTRNSNQEIIEIQPK